MKFVTDEQEEEIKEKILFYMDLYDDREDVTVRQQFLEMGFSEQLAYNFKNGKPTTWVTVYEIMKYWDLDFEQILPKDFKLPLLFRKYLESPYSISELCEKTGFIQSQFNKYWNGKSLPCRKNLIILSKVLNISLSEWVQIFDEYDKKLPEYLSIVKEFEEENEYVKI
ncbi:MAG: hypothetical protein ACOCQD_04905 [archaeon]